MDSFREEYQELIDQIDGWMGIPAAFAKYTELGPKRFHQFLGERLMFKEFVRRFYTQLRELGNVDDCELEDEFQKMRSKQWDFGIYAEHLKIRAGQ